MREDWGYSQVELESDALSLVNTVRGKVFGWAPVDLVHEDISLLSADFTSFSFYHVKRCGNTVAHLVARLLPLDGIEQLLVDAFPQGVLTLAELDFV